MTLPASTRNRLQNGASHATDLILLDVHAHVVPLRASDLDGLDGVRWASTDERLEVDGQMLPLQALYRPDELIEWMDTHGVAQAWISIPPTMYRPALDAAAAHRWADAVNTALLRTAAAHSSRLQALLHLPMPHPAVALQVARTAIAGGHRRFAMAAGVAASGRMLSDDAYEPLWTALSDAHAFLFLHPTRGCDQRLDRFYLQNLLGNPAETALAAAHLAMSGVLERHAGMTVCLAHAGGATAAAAGRLARGQDTERPGAYLGGERVRTALRRLCVDCIAHDPDALALAARVHGEDRVLFGSDWPFAMGLPQPHEQLAAVDPGLRRRIFHDNPQRLLRDLRD